MAHKMRRTNVLAVFEVFTNFCNVFIIFFFLRKYFALHKTENYAEISKTVNTALLA